MVSKPKTLCWRTSRESKVGIWVRGRRGLDGTSEAEMLVLRKLRQIAFGVGDGSGHVNSRVASFQILSILSALTVAFARKLVGN